MITSSKSLKSVVTLIFGATIVLGTLAACNTIEGAGQDVQSGGKVIERTADKNK